MESIRTVVLTALFGAAAMSVSYVREMAHDLGEIKVLVGTQGTSQADLRDELRENKVSVAHRLDRLETACLTSASRVRSTP